MLPKDFILSMVCPRMGVPMGIRLRKTHGGGDFDIHDGPQGGKFDSTANLEKLRGPGNQ